MGYLNNATHVIGTDVDESTPCAHAAFETNTPASIPTVDAVINYDLFESYNNFASLCPGSSCLILRAALPQRHFAKLTLTTQLARHGSRECLPAVTIV